IIREGCRARRLRRVRCSRFAGEGPPGGDPGAEQDRRSHQGRRPAARKPASRGIDGLTGLNLGTAMFGPSAEVVEGNGTRACRELTGCLLHGMMYGKMGVNHFTLACNSWANKLRNGITGLCSLLLRLDCQFFRRRCTELQDTMRGDLLE